MQTIYLAHWITHTTLKSDLRADAIAISAYAYTHEMSKTSQDIGLAFAIYERCFSSLCVVGRCRRK